MTAHAAAFDSETGFHEPVKGSFAKSAIFHAALLGGLLAWSLFQPSSEAFGDPNAGGASVGINVVDSIPIITQGQPNPVANDTESIAPQAPEEEVPVRPEPEPEPEEVVEVAEPIREQVTKQQAVSQTQRFRPYEELQKNQLTSKSAQRTSSEMFSQSAGAGQISTGANTTLGNRFGAYSATVRDIVARNWQAATLAAGITSGPAAVATFQIERNGRAVNYRLLQTSGNTALDLSIRRAIEDSSPFPPLPLAYDGDTATVEFIFELKQ